MRSLLCYLMLTCLSSAAVLAQSTLTGVIKGTDGQPLPGVTVQVKAGSETTTTDNAGKYSISAPGPGSTLIFSFVGMQTQEVTIGKKRVIDVVLEPSDDLLGEIVIIGYGKQSRETLTTAISKVDTKVLESTVLANPLSALQGTVAGVQVQTVSGQPGSSPRVVVRGGTSINNPAGAQPLYVVDGMLRDNLDGINAADIESMQVLKDAASTSIYGARASNGVVIVSLKKGAAGSTQISYNYSFGISQLRDKYDLLSAREYISFDRLALNAAIKEKYPDRVSYLDGAYGAGIGNDLSNNTAFTTQYLTEANNHKLNEGWESMPDPLDPSKTLIFANTDWQDVLFKTGKTNDHHLSFSGGSEKASFNLGLGYTSIDGIAIFTNYKRLTANLNAKYQFNEKFYAYGGLNFSRFNDNVVFNENQLFQRAIATAPTAKYTYEDGSLAPGFSRTLGNPAYHLSRSDNRNEDNLMTLNGGVGWTILPDLVFEPSASLYYRVEENSTFLKSYYDTPTQLVDSRVATAAYSKLDRQQLDATLSYNKSFREDHHLEAKLGLSYFKRNSRDIGASGRGAATDLIPTLNASAEAVSVTSSASEQIVFGYFGRAVYDYKQTYLLTLNARYDGASNLGINSKWGFFPGISAGWNVHHEPFWQNNEAVSKLKLRASYGVNGNLGNLTDFQPYGQYSVGAKYDGKAAIQYSVLANQDLKWEQSKTFDIGIDVGLLNDRVSFIADYYNRNTENLITSLALPYLSGFESILTNYGSLKNQGFEVELTASVINSGLFNWTMSVNSSFNKNKILKLPTNNNENNRVGGIYVFDPSIGDYAWLGGLQEGGTMGEMFGYQFVSVYPTDEAAAAGPVDQIVSGTDKTKYGGDVEWRDVDGNGIIDTRDMLYMGNSYPKWTGGLSNTWSYKGLDVYLRLDYMTGHTIYNYTRLFLNGQLHGDANATTDVLKAWSEQGQQTDVPRNWHADQTGPNNLYRNGGGSSEYYEKGDFLAIRELTVSYKVPATLLQRIKLQSLSVNLTGNNLKYFTGYKGPSPELGGQDDGRYPIPRTFTMGIKASF